MNITRLTGIVLNLGWILSLSMWIYGNSIEQGDMSNAGYQILGGLGTVGFGILATAYFVALFFESHKK